MSEFSTANAMPGASMAPPVPPASIQGQRPGWLQRPLLLGLTPPWLAGFSLMLILGAAYTVYQFFPDRTPTVTQLAFKREPVDMPDNGQPAAGFKDPAPFNTGPDLSQVQDQVATMVGGVRSYAEANRTAIERLAQTSKTQSEQLILLQQQLSEALAQNSVLSARVSLVERKPVSTQRSVRRAPVAEASPLAQMHVSAVQNGMAWVRWQEQTWAVQVGDRLGAVTVTGIDADTRQVRTSAGIIK